MGSGLSKQSVIRRLAKTNSNTNNKSLFLKFTPEEVRGIRKVWAKALERDVIMELLIAVIVQRPNFAEFFSTTYTTESDLRQSIPVQGHAAKIAGFIDNLIRGLDEITVGDIRRMLFDIGVNHFHKKVDFDAGNYLLFKKILMEKICEGVDETTTKAWFKLLGLMIKEMKNGYFAEALKNGTTLQPDEKIDDLLTKG